MRGSGEARGAWKENVKWTVGILGFGGEGSVGYKNIVLFEKVWYNYFQKNKRRSSGRGERPLSDILLDGMLGDKEIAVRIRSNSHYRISCLGVKSECLSVCEP